MKCIELVLQMQMHLHIWISLFALPMHGGMLFIERDLGLNKPGVEVATWLWQLVRRFKTGIVVIGSISRRCCCYFSKFATERVIGCSTTTTQGQRWRQHWLFFFFIFFCLGLRWVTRWAKRNEGRRIVEQRWTIRLLFGFLLRWLGVFGYICCCCCCCFDAVICGFDIK